METNRLRQMLINYANIHFNDFISDMNYTDDATKAEIYEEIRELEVNQSYKDPGLNELCAKLRDFLSK
ncbi:MAG: hypothetical protein LBK58_00700 [Prevotellaceae bacterium]|jgi:tRNA(Ile)-lysidine synthase TilS/MesJ|nr:hypothetical protein [Prevotellaceae bacterium]